MKKIPDNASFPVPPVSHAAWDDHDWYNYWKSTGGRIDNSPPYVNPDPMPSPYPCAECGHFHELEDFLKNNLDK